MPQIHVDESDLDRIAGEVGKLLVDDFALVHFHGQIREYVRLDDGAAAVTTN